MTDKKNYINKIENIVAFILIAIWFSIPISKEITCTTFLADASEMPILNFIGLIGIYLLILKFYNNFSSREDKKEYLKENLPILIFTLFMVWTLISSIFAVNKDYAFSGTEYRKEGYMTYLAYAGVFGLAFLLDSQKLKKALLNIFIGIAIVNIIFMELASNFYFIGILQYQEVARGVFHNINHYGYYLLMVTSISALLFVYEKNKVVKVMYLLAYIFLLYYLIINNTMGVYLALFLTLALFLIYCISKKQKRLLSLILMIIFILMSCFTNIEGKNIAKRNIISLGKDLSQVFHLAENKKETLAEGKINNSKTEFEMAGSGRIKIWKYGIKFFLQKPILGYGPENLGEKYKEEGIIQDRPHNLIIQLATTSGIVGLILYLTAIGLILKRALKYMSTNNYIQIVTFFAVIAYLISAMFGNSMFYTSPYFFIILGFLTYENIKRY